MARETTRRANTRVKADLSEGRGDVKIQEQRRFFQARGNDGGVREARALADAFGVTTQFVGTQIDRANVAGKERAVEQAALGQERDADDENGGYIKEWNRLTDKRSLQVAAVGLTEALRQADAESLNEEQRQEVINGYFEGEFKGMDVDDADHSVLAQGILDLETEAVVFYRTLDLQKTKQAQLSESFASLRAEFEETGVFNYEDAAIWTRTFTEGKERMTAYNEMVWDVAIELGRPDIIENEPPKFPNGEPTAKNNPHLADERRAAIRSATVRMASNAKAEQDAVDLQRDNLRFDTQFAIYEARRQGADVTPLIRQLAAIPGTDFADISAAKNFGDGQLDETESRSPDLTFTAPLWKQIHEGSAGIEAIFFARQQGFLGFGPQADKLMDDMMGTARTVQNSRESLSNPDVTVWRAQVNRQYNAALKGTLNAINPAMHRINIAANAFYTEQVGNGVDAMEAFNKTAERFDPILANTDIVGGAENPLEHKPQSQFVDERIITPDALKAVGSGQISYLDAFAGVNANQIISVLDSALRNEGDGKDLTEEEIELIYSYID